MKVTLKDIAEKSGYSISTVSRVLNGSDKISTEVQKEIVKLAEELDYPFKKSKVPFLTNGQLKIAMVTDFREGEFYGSMFYGFSKAAREQDISLTLMDVGTDEKDLYRTLNRLDEKVYDGATLFMPELNQEDYQRMLSQLETSIPLVSNAMIQSPVIPTITFDGYSGGHHAAEHFISGGYRRIGIIKGPFGKAESRFRYNGFKDHLNHSGLEIFWEADGSFIFDSGVKAFEEFHKLDVKPEALFISNDLMGKGFMESAKEQGYKIPEDVAIITYDDLPMCTESYPKMTAVHTDFCELARTTFQTIRDIITKKHNRKATLNLIPVHLVERETARNVSQPA